MTIPPSVKVWITSLSLGAVGGTLFGLLVLSGDCKLWREDHPKPPDPQVEDLQPSPGEQEMERKVEPCLPVEVLLPSPRERKRVAKESGRPEFATEPRPPAPDAPRAGLPPASPEIGPQKGSSEVVGYPKLLAEKQIPPMPAGGTVWVWLEMGGKTTISALANPVPPAPAEKFWDFRPTYLIGGAYSPLGGETRGKVYAGVEFLRAGRFHVRVEGGADFIAGQSGTYGMLGVEWRSR